MIDEPGDAKAGTAKTGGTKTERVLHGLAISPGIAIGPAFISDDGDINVPNIGSMLAP